MKVAIVTNIPAPYRLPLYEILNKKLNNNFVVIFCAQSETNREWDVSLSSYQFNFEFLKENFYEKSDGFNYIHHNPDIFKVLKKYSPDIIITTGYSPTFIYAWFYSQINRKIHIPMTDGWCHNEKNLSIAHKLLRILFFNTSKAFIGASNNSLNLFKAYHIKKKSLFKSCLCIDNSKFKSLPLKQRQFDLMYAGHLDNRKNILFLTRLICKINKLKKIKFLLLGNGPLKNDVLTTLTQNNIDYHYPGFAHQNRLPYYYSNTKIFLFPTNNDPWGIVLNEAMASGAPVIASPYTGTINDLLIDEFNGYIVDLEMDKWIKNTLKLLTSEKTWEKLSRNALNKVTEFNYKNASNGILDACKYAQSR